MDSLPNTEPTVFLAPPRADLTVLVILADIVVVGVLEGWFVDGSAVVVVDDGEFQLLLLLGLLIYKNFFPLVLAIRHDGMMRQKGVLSLRHAGQMRENDDTSFHPLTAKGREISYEIS